MVRSGCGVPCHCPCGCLSPCCPAPPALQQERLRGHTSWQVVNAVFQEASTQPARALGPPETQTTGCFLPPAQIPEHCRPSMEEGISLFSSLLSNKHFLIVFVHALEQQKDFAVRDRSG